MVHRLSSFRVFTCTRPTVTSGTSTTSSSTSPSGSSATSSWTRATGWAASGWRWRRRPSARIDWSNREVLRVADASGDPRKPEHGGGAGAVVRAGAALRDYVGARLQAERSAKQQRHLLRRRSSWSRPRRSAGRTRRECRGRGSCAPTPSCGGRRGSARSDRPARPTDAS